MDHYEMCGSAGRVPLYGQEGEREKSTGDRSGAGSPLERFRMSVV